MDQVGADFFIAKENFPDVVRAIHNLANYPEKMGGRSAGKPHYSWIGDNFDKINDIEEIFQYWRWEVYLDDDGNICDLNFEGSKLGDDHILLNAIAPFVREGSYIEMRGEDNEHWRWVIHQGKIKIQYPEVIWK